MNDIEKNFFSIIITIFFLCVCSAVGGYIFGRNHTLGTLGVTDADQQLKRTISELRQELNREREVITRLRENDSRERELIDRITENTRRARADVDASISHIGGAAEKLQNIIDKMEIYNDYVRSNERELAGYYNMAGSQVD